jgi:hypothetical protein
VEIRASDDDRQRVIAVLQEHTEAGRLSLDEFSERVGEAYAARTLADLAAVTRELPVAHSARSTVEQPSRQLLFVFAVAAVSLVLLALFMAATR